jgi:hypothetical protein
MIISLIVCINTNVGINPTFYNISITITRTRTRTRTITISQIYGLSAYQSFWKYLCNLTRTRTITRICGFAKMRCRTLTLRFQKFLLRYSTMKQDFNHSDFINKMSLTFCCGVRIQTTSRTHFFVLIGTVF